MPTKNKALTMAAVLVLAPLLVMAAAVAAAVGLFEAHDVEQGSLHYVVGVPGSVRSVARTVDACHAPQWQWKGRDGVSAPYIAMHYSSAAALDEALRQHSIALAPLSCHPDGEPQRFDNVIQQSLRCTHPDVAAVDISVGREVTGKERRCREISLTFLEND